MTVLFFVVSVGLVKAQIKLPTPMELCSYESKYRCEEASTKPLIHETVKPFQKFKPLVINLAAKYGVDPVSIVVAPVTEMSLNVGLTDDVQDLIADTFIGRTMRKAGKTFSIGPGQIYLPAAKDVEAMAAKVEGRPVRTDDEITRALLTVPGALGYSAAILKKAQDSYAAKGFDVSKRPEILASLYNMGRPADRAEKTKKSGLLPRPNFFGYYAGKHYYEVQKIMGLPSNLEPQSGAISVAKSAQQESGPVPKELQKDVYVVKSLGSSSLPEICFSGGKKTSTKQSLSLSGEFEILTRTVGCNLEPWLYLKTKDGLVGWVTEKALLANKTLAAVKAEKKQILACANQIKAGCVAKIKAVGSRIGFSIEGESDDLYWEINPPSDINVKKKMTKLTSEIIEKLESSLKVPRSCKFQAGGIYENPTSCYVPTEVVERINQGMSIQDMSSQSVLSLPALHKKQCEEISGNWSLILNEAKDIFELGETRKSELANLIKATTDCGEKYSRSVYGTSRRNSDKSEKGIACRAIQAVCKDFLSDLTDEVDRALKSGVVSSKSGDSKSLFDKSLWSAVNAESCFERAFVPEDAKLNDSKLSEFFGKMVPSNSISGFNRMVLELQNDCPRNPEAKKGSRSKVGKGKR